MDGWGGFGLEVLVVVGEEDLVGKAVGLAHQEALPGKFFPLPLGQCRGLIALVLLPRFINDHAFRGVDVGDEQGVLGRHGVLDSKIGAY